MNLNTPSFGPLAGVKVAFSAMEVAGPFSAQMLAEWGAEVIWIENSKYPDTIRVQKNYKELCRRNLYSLSLNIFSDEGKKVFFDLIKDVDIFIEASKGPAFANKGLTEELLWEHNPKLVIAHLSGFGQVGDEKFTNLAAYNTIAQAFSGYLIQNGDIDQPMPAFPYTADYMSGFAVTSSVLAALYKAQQTGKGESIDIAMYEVMLRVGQYYMMDYFNDQKIYPRMIKGKDPLYAGCGLYTCVDGYIVFEVVGISQIKDMLDLLNLTEYYGQGDLPEGIQLIARSMSINDIFERRLDEFFKDKTIEESLEILKNIKVAGAKVLEFKDLENNPQYIARESITTWQNNQDKTIKGPNVMPKFKNNPGKIWRAMPEYGADSKLILEQLGYTSEDIERLKENKIVKVGE